mgnify:CR=1 FL=1
MALSFISAGFLLIIFYTVKKLYSAFKYAKKLSINERKENEKQYYKDNKYFLSFGIGLILTGILISLIYKP